METNHLSTKSTSQHYSHSCCCCCSTVFAIYAMSHTYATTLHSFTVYTHLFMKNKNKKFHKRLVTVAETHNVPLESHCVCYVCSSGRWTHGINRIYFRQSRRYPNGHHRYDEITNKQKNRRREKHSIL